MNIFKQPCIAEKPEEYDAKSPERMFLKQRKVIENSIKTLTRRGFFDSKLVNSFGSSWQIKM